MYDLAENGTKWYLHKYKDRIKMPPRRFNQLRLGNRMFVKWCLTSSLTTLGSHDEKKFVSVNVILLFFFVKVTTCSKAIYFWFLRLYVANFVVCFSLKKGNERYLMAYLPHFQTFIFDWFPLLLSRTVRQQNWNHP